MRLEVRGMEKASQKFVQLWGMYVSGFKQDKHCMYCLEGKKEPGLHKDIGDIDLELSNDWEYFYLFAMGRMPRRDTNVHLPVRSRPGSVASVGSVYGVTFTIYDAIAIRVDRLPRGWMGLDKLFTDCRNFQFGVQQFGYRPLDGSVHPFDPSLLPEEALSDSKAGDSDSISTKDDLLLQTVP